MTWSLFYRFDNEVPTDFHELRQFGSSLWAANGKVKTMGRSSVAEFASPQAAKDALVQRSSEIEAQGYKRVRQGTHDPASHRLSLAHRRDSRWCSPRLPGHSRSPPRRNHPPLRARQ